MPYYCFSPGCTERQGFLVADPFDDNNADLHIDYADIILATSQQLYSALSQDGILPNQEARDILEACDGDGFVCLHDFNCQFNPLLMAEEDARELVPRHPVQGGRTFAAYSRTVDFHYHMRALILDNPTDITSEANQDLFAQGLDLYSEIKDDIREARESNSDKRKRRVQGYQFCNTVSTWVKKKSLHLKPTSQLSSI